MKILFFAITEAPTRQKGLSMDDLIYKQAAIDALKAMEVPRYLDAACEDIWERDRTLDNAIDVIHALPSARPEIIRCKDCKYRDENWRRVSVRWLPCMDVRTGSNWYCGSAERKDDE